jgi:hypothetical protein
LQCDGTRAETRFGLPAKRTSPYKLAGASVLSTTGSRGGRICDSNAGYTMFRGSVTVLATHYIRQFPLHFPSLRHRVPSHSNWTLRAHVEESVDCLEITEAHTVLRDERTEAR